MIRINLLPIRQMKKRLQTRNEVIAFVASLVVVLALLVMASLSMNRTVTTLQADIGALNAKKAQYDKIIQEIKQLETEKAKLTTKIDAIKMLKSQSQISVRLLDAIATATPADSIWLKTLKQIGNTVDIEGIALDNTRLAGYMETLTASPYFAGATLGKSSLETVAGQQLKSFSLSLAVQAPAGGNTESKQGDVK